MFQSLPILHALIARGTQVIYLAEMTVVSECCQCKANYSKSLINCWTARTFCIFDRLLILAGLAFKRQTMFFRHMQHYLWSSAICHSF